MLEEEKQSLLKFLQDQNCVVIATIDEENNPWVTNMYYASDNDFNLIFFTPPHTKHSEHTLNNSNAAFGLNWYNKDNLKDRMGIQGIGIYERVEDPLLISRFINTYHTKYPSSKTTLTEESMLMNKIASRLYRVKPKYIKFWNDKLFGEGNSKELFF